MTTHPALLDAQVIAAREQLFILLRRVRALTEAYDELDTDTLDVDNLDVDNLGDPITAAAARTEAIDALSDITMAINDADAAFDRAMRYTSRLKERA